MLTTIMTFVLTFNDYIKQITVNHKSLIYAKSRYLSTSKMGTTKEFHLATQRNIDCNFESLHKGENSKIERINSPHA